MADMKFPHRPVSNTKKTITYTHRYYFIFAILLLAAAALVWRLVDLTVLKHVFLQGQGDARTLRTIPVPAYRGMILDRNGAPLAISTPVDSVWVNPKEFVVTSNDFTQLAALLKMTPHDLKTRIVGGANHEFVYLKRDIDPNLGASIAALKIPGIYLQQQFHRFYPEGEVTAHVVGFTNVDDQGQEGLELAYNDWLQGAPGLRRVLKDRYGHIVANVDMLKAPHAGQNLTLSIDRRIEYFAYRELAAGVAKYKADSGSIVILDVKTGEILGMVNWPSYNPNNRQSDQDGRYRNRAVTDTFEPGSTIKPFSMVNALQSGKYHVNSTVDTAPGWILVDGKKITDDEHDEGVIDLTTVLKVSSNVGMSKITLSLPPENWWNVLHAMGFGQLTDSGFPGERAGILTNYPVWNPFVLATMSFGYGLTVTPLQLAQAYATLANGGIKQPVTFLRGSAPISGKQVIDPKVAGEILTMLESVLAKGGTAPLARVPGYRVTGKTGTAHIVGPRGYEKNHYNSVFVGVAPASNPELVVAVVLHDPQGTQYYGGYTAGPVFAHVMGEALRLLNVPPDDLSSLNAKATPVAPPPTDLMD